MFKGDKLFLIDFGMATSYTDDMTQTNNNDIIGSPKYISLNVHEGKNPTRIDDMISLGYIYLYMIGSWPPRISEVDFPEINARIEKYKEAKRFDNIIKLGVQNKIHSYIDVFYRMKFNGVPDYKRIMDKFMD